MSNLSTLYLGKNNPNYKHGKKSKIEGNRCPKCKVPISYNATYCRSCAMIISYNKRGRLTTKEKIDKKREYRTTLKYKNFHNKYVKYRYQNDTSFKVEMLLRSRINQAIRGYRKSKSTTQLLGCSINQLKEHLEKQFKSGMSWDNYGTWHIDHIKPRCSFDLSKPKEQKKCFHYSNLQPLWAEENFKKNRGYNGVSHS